MWRLQFLSQNKEQHVTILYSLQRCASLPTNVLGPNDNIILPSVWGQLPYSQTMPSTTSLRNPPITINPNLGPNQSPSPLEDTNRYSVAQSRDIYHRLPPIDFPRKESQSDYASEDIQSSEVTSDSLLSYQVMWSVWFTALWNDW
jgi:hypothetical protein